MIYLLFAGLAEAQARTAQAYAEGMEAGIFAPGTQQYAQPIRNPFSGQFALPVDPSFTTLFTPAEIAQSVELPAEWFAVGIIPGEFVITEPISPAPSDLTITRQAFCNIPVVQSDKVKTFVLQVVVKHFRDGVHIWAELPDKEVKLTADNVDGEFDQFYNWIAQG